MGKPDTPFSESLVRESCDNIYHERVIKEDREFESLLWTSFVWKLYLVWCIGHKCIFGDYIVCSKLYIKVWRMTSPSLSHLDPKEDIMREGSWFWIRRMGECHSIAYLETILIIFQKFGWVSSLSTLILPFTLLTLSLRLQSSSMQLRTPSPSTLRTSSLIEYRSLYWPHKNFRDFWPLSLYCVILCFQVNPPYGKPYGQHYFIKRLLCTFCEWDRLTLATS